MEADTAKRRMLIGMLVSLFTVAAGTIVWVAGGGPTIAAWYRSADKLTQQMPVNDPQYMYARALEYQHEGDSSMALAAARRATIVDPSYAPAHRFLAAEAIKSKDFDLAAKESRQILQNDPNDGSAALGLASAYEGMGQPAKAEEIYRTTMQSQAFNNLVRQKAKENLGSLHPDTLPARPMAPPP
jgi:Tfp pilus assembly protein PilF